VALGTSARAFRRPGPHGFPQPLHPSFHHLRSATSCVHDPQLAPRDQDRNMGPHKRGMPGSRAAPSFRNGQLIVIARTRRHKDTSRPVVRCLAAWLRVDEAKRRGRVPFAASRQSPDSPPKQTPTVRSWKAGTLTSQPSAPRSVSIGDPRGVTPGRGFQRGADSPFGPGLGRAGPEQRARSAKKRVQDGASAKKGPRVARALS